MTDQEIHERIDALQAKVEEFIPVDCPVNHVFTPMLYTRHIFMPADTLIISKIHKYQHPYDVMTGIAWVRINDGEWQKIEAPYSGITEAGTRRVLFIEKDCWWKTSHVTDVFPEDDTEEAVEEAVRKIEELIIIPRQKLIFNQKTEMIDL